MPAGHRVVLLSTRDRRTTKAARRAIGEYLRQVRVSRGLSQTAVAEALNRSQSFVSKYERGELKLELVELVVICDALGISLTELVHTVAAIGGH